MFQENPFRFSLSMIPCLLQLIKFIGIADAAGVEFPDGLSGGDHFGFKFVEVLAVLFPDVVRGIGQLLLFEGGQGIGRTGSAV